MAGKGRQIRRCRSIGTIGWRSAMQGKARRAITLFGAAAALREAWGNPPPPINQADNERGIAAARAQLDEAAFNVPGASVRP